jgi:hypothetical protein
MAVSWFPRSKLEPGKTSRKMKLPVQKWYSKPFDSFNNLNSCNISYIWARVRKCYRGRGLPSPLQHFRPKPKYNLYCKTVTLYFFYPVTNLIKYFLHHVHMIFN